MSKSFCISGFGRSGTQWLAELMGKSQTWTILHEPGGKAFDLDTIAERFHVGKSAGNYGEVNSNCLAVLRALRVDRKAVILRCPRRLVVSCVRKGHALTDDLLDNINTGLAIMDWLITCEDCQVIAMKQMLTDIPYTSNLLLEFGVEDVAVTEDDMSTVVNASTGNLKWTRLSPESRSQITARFDWFSRKYERYLDTVSA